MNDYDRRRLEALERMSKKPNSIQSCLGCFGVCLLIFVVALIFLVGFGAVMSVPANGATFSYADFADESGYPVHGMAVSDSGDVFLASRNAIRSYTPAGVMVDSYVVDRFDAIWELENVGDGFVGLVSDSTREAVNLVRLSYDGNVGTTITTRFQISDRINQLAFDGEHLLIGTGDFPNEVTLRKVTLSGAIVDWYKLTSVDRGDPVWPVDLAYFDGGLWGPRRNQRGDFVILDRWDLIDDGYVISESYDLRDVGLDTSFDNKSIAIDGDGVFFVSETEGKNVVSFQVGDLTRIPEPASASLAGIVILAAIAIRRKILCLCTI